MRDASHALTRRTLLALLGAALARPAGAQETAALETPIDVTSLGRRIAGTLARPLSGAPSPVVLIIAGSGPTDRDGNNPLGIAADTYKELAAALAARSVASVRYDKRYVGESNVPPLDDAHERFDDEVADAIAWLRLLANDGRFRGVTVAGHSQGSLTGMLAAERVVPFAFVSLEGAGRDGGTIILEQIAARYPADVTAKARAVIARLEAGETSADVPPALYTLLRPSIQPYLMSWIPYDPAAEIAQLRCPVTIVQGTADTQTGMLDARALAAAAPSARLVVVPEMTHTLKLAGPEIAPIQTYLDPSLPIAPAVVDAIVAAAG